MGANEKYEAAMHGGQEYTPELIDLRVAYRYMEAGLMMDPDSKPHDPVLMAESDAGFDRFIAKIRAEAKAEALTDMAHVLEADIPGHAHENGQIIAGRNIIRIIRARANQYKEAPSA